MEWKDYNIFKLLENSSINIRCCQHTSYVLFQRKILNYDLKY